MQYLRIIYFVDVNKLYIIKVKYKNEQQVFISLKYRRKYFSRKQYVRMKLLSDLSTSIINTNTHGHLLCFNKVIIKEGISNRKFKR